MLIHVTRCLDTPNNPEFVLVSTKLQGSHSHFNDYMFLKCVLIPEGQMFTRKGIVFHNVKLIDSYSYLKLHC